MILGHIGARKGSQGVVGKNDRPLLGKPLIDWSLDQLFDHPRIDAIVVSTDHEGIYERSVARGTLPIGLRPAHLATSAAGKWGVWQHALEASEDLLSEPVSVFVDLDCTSPLRLMSDIDDAIDLYVNADPDKRPDMVLPCCEARKNPYFNMVERDERGGLQISKPLPGGVLARQQAPEVLEHAASTYVLDPEYLKRASSLFEGYVIPHILPAERCWDIDAPLDFKIVEFLMKERLAENPD
jgi:N-acylneuraminate cytidylyltransferase